MDHKKAEDNRKRVRDALKEALPGNAFMSFEDDDCDKLYKKRCTTVEFLRSPSVLDVLGEEPDALHPSLVAHLREAAANATKLPLPAVALSYTKIKRAWETADHGLHYKEYKYLHESAEGAEKFRTFWEKHQAEFEKMSIKLRFCQNEKTTNSYEDCKKLLQSVFRYIHDVMGFEGNDRTGQSLLRLFCNQTAEDDTRPDVAACEKDPWTEILSNQMYKFLILVAELKPDLQSTPAKGLNDGMGEVISRADQARAARDIPNFTLPGMVTDNRLLRAMVVHASQNRKQQYVEVGQSHLRLMPEDASKNASFAQAVDSKGKGFKEVVFLCWRAAELRLRAAAESPKLDIPEDGLQISVRARDGTSFSFVLHKQLSAPGAPNLVCAGIDPHDGFDVIVKIGPPRGIVPGAKGLSISDEEFLQVEREMLMLKLLRPHDSPFLPHLVCGGHLEGSPVPMLLGRSVVVTPRYGRALIGPDGALPLLSPPALLRLAADVLAGIKDLQAASISHNDLRPQNFGASKTGYYVYDLGAASLLSSEDAIREHACSLEYSSTRIIQGKQPKAISDVEMLLYSLIKLAGNSLPWEDAAKEGDWLGCLTARLQLVRSRVLPECIQHLPVPLPAFARRVLQCVAKGGSASWIAGWVSHLRAVAAWREEKPL